LGAPERQKVDLHEANCGGNAFNWVIYGKLDEGSLVSGNQFGAELGKFRLGFD
jgi:hypothetical protein